MTQARTGYEEIVRRMNDEVWGEANLELVDEYVSADYVEHNTASPEPLRGPDGYKDNVRMLHDAFSDVEVTTEHLFAEGEKVVNHYTITGTHDGPFMGLEPTGIEVRISGISIGQIDAGKVVAGWTVADTMGLLQQLGAVEAPGE